MHFWSFSAHSLPPPHLDNSPILNIIKNSFMGGFCRLASLEPPFKSSKIWPNLSVWSTALCKCVAGRKKAIPPFWKRDNRCIATTRLHCASWIPHFLAAPRWLFTTANNWSYPVCQFIADEFSLKQRRGQIHDFLYYTYLIFVLIKLVNFTGKYFT